jgi:hypothetical protein
MIPTWAAVVSAIALGIIALSAIVVALSAALAALGVRATLGFFRQLAGPAVEDVRALIGTIRGETDALVGTSREIRTRIVRAADAAEVRLSDLAALVDVMQGEVDAAALDAAVVASTVRKGITAFSIGKRLFRRRPRKRKPS